MSLGLIVSAIEFVMLKGFDAKVLKVGVAVAIIDANAQSIKASKKKTFMFKISPPYSFFIQE